MYELPTSISIDGQPYGITRKGDYRMVIDCFEALNDAELTKQERAYSALILFYEDINDIADIIFEFDTGEKLAEAIKKMYWFFDCGQANVGAKSNHKLLDWQQDEQMITSAVNNVAHTEIRSIEYLHWWTFMGYYMSVGESVLSTVVAIRDKIVKGKKLEDYEKEFKRDNPQYFVWDHKTLEDKELDKEFDKIVDKWHNNRE